MKAFLILDSDLDCAAAAVLVTSSFTKKKKSLRKKGKQRTVWTKPWLNHRNVLGVYKTYLGELHMEDEAEHKKFLRMTLDIFDDLLNLIECEIQKKRTIMRDPIPPDIKLAAILRSLSTGANYAEMQHIYRTHQSIINKFIPKVCQAIYTRLKDAYLKVIWFICIK